MSSIVEFQSFIWDYYKNYGRQFAWRNINNPYYVIVSEIMLQQTQTSRVEKKYEQFITAFGTFEELAQTSLRDVLSVWQGLGYYRRARYLHQIAQKIIQEYNGIVPTDPAILQTFPGIGSATASSICAFAFNRPTVFIETNIRAVFIHYFFQNKVKVQDREIMPIIAESLDNTNPREWYYALMDYGVALKARYGNLNKKSAHYVKQSKFEGSDRQIRAKILKIIMNTDDTDKNDLIVSFSEQDKDRVDCIIQELQKEKFIECVSNGKYKIV